MEAFPCSKNIQVLDEARFEYPEQLCQFGQLHTPNRNHVINLGTDSI
jgi:hypothetical protein